MKALAAALALAFAAIAPQALAQDGSFSATYNVHARGMQAGEATYNFTFNGGSYTGASERRMTGMARTLLGNSQDYTYSVRGAVDAAGVHPATYQHQGGRRGRVVNVNFTGEDIVTRANPEMGMGNPPATTAQKTGAIDQVSMFAQMLLKDGDPCQQTIKVYMDGRSRFDFVMTPNGRQNVQIAGFRGEASRCRVQFRPIAGFGDPQAPAELTFLFAEAPNGMNVPIRIEMPSEDAGVIRLEARSFTAR